MRVARLSVTLASTLRCPFMRMGTRFMHSSAQMRNIKVPREIPAEWLRRIVEDGSKPPKLYAWTPKNLSLRDRDGLESGQCSHTDTAVNIRGHNDDYERRRIYILGVGNIGRLYAICLSKLINRPPITLVVHRRELLERWVAEPGIELTRYGHVYRSAEFDIEWWTDMAPSEGPVAEVAAGRTISNLIVATKASDAMPQVDRIRRYLGSDSTVAFAQNGVCKLWPPLGDAYVRTRFPEGADPNWIACVTTHGVTSHAPFKSIHASPANALVGPVALSSSRVNRPGEVGDQTTYLIRQIADAPDLDAQELPRKDLWVGQLQKLVINTTINPLTAVLRCRNGELFEARDDAIPAVIDKLLGEASETLSTLILDSSSDEILAAESASQGAISEDSTAESLHTSREQLLQQFSFPQLHKTILEVGAKVAANTSSMLQDVRAGKQTEIDDLNGWLVDTAKLLDKGLRLPTHEKLIALVKAQSALTRSELCESLLGANNC